MNRITVVAVAAVVTVVSAFGLVRYVGAAEDRATASAELVTVLLVSSEIREGVTFEAAWTAGDIVRSETLRSTRPSTAIVDPAALSTEVSVGTLHRGQTVVEGDFVDTDARVRTGPATFATSLPEGTVAVSFDALGAEAVSGLITPGDRVNLLVQVPNAAELGLPDSGGPAVVHVFQDLLILAIGATTVPDDDAKEAAVNPGTGNYTVAVDPLDSARLLLLTRQYTVLLTLVGPGTTPEEQPPVDRTNALPDSPEADDPKAARS